MEKLLKKSRKFHQQIPYYKQIEDSKMHFLWTKDKKRIKSGTWKFVVKNQLRSLIPSSMLYLRDERRNEMMFYQTVQVTLMHLKYKQYQTMPVLNLSAKIRNNVFVVVSDTIRFG